MNNEFLLITAPHLYGENAGKVNIYTKNDQQIWSLSESLIPNDDHSLDFYGWNASLSKDQIIIGSPRDDFDYNNDNELNDAGSIYIFTKDDLMIDEINQMYFKLYPNPVKNILHIQSKEVLISSEIFTINGQKISSFSDTSFDASILKKGIYIIVSKTKSGKKFEQKFIKN